MPTTRNVDRALNYVTQSLDLFHKLQPFVVIPQDQLGAWVSLQRNLESALVDLGGSVTEAPPTP